MIDSLPSLSRGGGVLQVGVMDQVIVLSGWKSVSWAGFRLDSERESRKIDLREKETISMFSRLESGQRFFRKPDFQPG